MASGISGDTERTVGARVVRTFVRTAAAEYAPHEIRVNSLHPTGLATRMGNIPRILELFQERPDLAGSYGNALPVDRVDPLDVSNAMVWLASDESRYVTGVTLPVDAGSADRQWVVFR